MDNANEVEIISWGPPDPNWNPWLNQPVIIEGAEEYQVIFELINLLRVSPLNKPKQCSAFVSFNV